MREFLFYYLKHMIGGMYISQSFMTYEQQLKKLVDDKKLIIRDINYAEQVLKKISYFSLITGYKSLFKESHEGHFISNL